MFLSIFYSTAQILGNVEVAGDNTKARKYYEGSTYFMTSLTQILEALTSRVSQLAAEDIRAANVSQIYGIFLLAFVMMLSPILLVLARNGITSIQVCEERLFKVAYFKLKEDVHLFLRCVFG